METENKFKNFPDLADALWLLGCFKAYAGVSGYGEKNGGAADESEQAQKESSKIQEKLFDKTTYPDPIIRVPLPIDKSDTVLSLEIRKVTPTYARGLPLLRALRPLKKRRASLASRPVMDVEQTIYRIAKECIVMGGKVSLQPSHLALSPQKSRVYDLALVVDTYFTMSFYARDLQVFLDTVLQSGAFHRVRLYHLDVRDKKPHIYAQSTLNLPFDQADHQEEISDRGMKPKDLIASSPRHPRIYLFLSDFFSPIWNNWAEGNENEPTIKYFIKELMQSHHLVSLAHVLPRHLWDRSALQNFDRQRVSLDTHPRLWMPFGNSLQGQDVASASSELLPVFHLSPDGLRPWVRSLVGYPKAEVSVLDLKMGDGITSRSAQRESVGWEEKVETFLYVAPPNVARLAMYLGCLLNTELPQDVVLFLAKEMIPGLESADLMYLFCSGLFSFEQTDPRFGEVAFVHSSISKLLADRLPEHKQIQTLFAYQLKYMSKDETEKNNFLRAFFRYKKTGVPEEDETFGVFPQLLALGIIETEEEIRARTPHQETFPVKPEPVMEKREQITAIKLKDMPRKPALHISLWGWNNARDRQLLIQGVMRTVYKSYRASSENSWQVQELGRYGQIFTPNYLMHPVDPSPNEFGSDKVFLIQREKLGAVIFYHDYSDKDISFTQQFYNSSLMSNVLLLCVSWKDLSDTQRRKEFSRNLLELYNWVNNQQNRKFKIFLALQDAPFKKAVKKEKTSKERSEEVYNFLLAAGVEKYLCDIVFLEFLDSRRAFLLSNDYNLESILFEEMLKEIL